MKGASSRAPLDWALRLAQIDSALRLARHALSTILKGLPSAERLRLVKARMETASVPSMAIREPTAT